MLVEREVDAKLLSECIASNLAFSTTNKLDPLCDQIWTLAVDILTS